MKFVGGLIVMCLLIIGFNLVLSVYGAMNNSYDPANAQRMAQFVIVLIPLTFVWCVMYVVKRILKSTKKNADKQ